MSIVNGQYLDIVKIEVFVDEIGHNEGSLTYHINMVYSYDSDNNRDFYPHLTFTEDFESHGEILDFITDHLPVEEEIIKIIAE